MKKTNILFLCFLLLLTLTACSFAQDAEQEANIQTWQLEDAVQWLEIQDLKLYALSRTGTITQIDINSGNSQILEEGWQGNFLTSCHDDVIGVNAQGNLSSLLTAWDGPEVGALSRPVCLATETIVAVDPEGNLLLIDTQGNLLERVAVDALRDAQLTQADVDNDGSQDIIVLSNPSERYGHGVLGDRTEAESVTVVDGETFSIKASFTLPEPFVFEQLRVTPFLTEDRILLLGTRSSRQTGAGVIALELQDVQDKNLVQVGEAGVIGLGNRWLNLFDSSNGEAYAIKTPHIGGPLQRYSLVNGEFQLSSETVGVSNHRIGSRNLDLGVLQQNENGTTNFIAPQYDQKTLEAFSCAVAEPCTSTWSYSLDNLLTSNLLAITLDGRNNSQSYIAAADQSGQVYLIPNQN